MGPGIEHQLKNAPELVRRFVAAHGSGELDDASFFTACKEQVIQPLTQLFEEGYYNSICRSTDDYELVNEALYSGAKACIYCYPLTRTRPELLDDMVEMLGHGERFGRLLAEFSLAEFDGDEAGRRQGLMISYQLRARLLLFLARHDARPEFARQAYDLFKILGDRNGMDEAELLL